MSTVFIPVDGAVRHYGDGIIPREQAAFGADEKLVKINMAHDGEPAGTASFLLSDEENHRARAALARITNTHFILTGPVLFEDLSEADTKAILDEVL